MPLDFTSFKNALGSLNKALARSLPSPEDDELRDACIQRFEYTYELAYKMLARFLEASSANPQEVDEFTFRDVVRVGAEKGLIKNIEDWFTYRAARNKTSLTYDRDEAEEVYSVIPSFINDAQNLFDQFQKKSSYL